MTDTRSWAGRRLATLAVLAALASVAAADPDPPPVRGRLDAGPANRFVVGDEAEQVVTVTRRSAYQIDGLAVAEAARYTLASRLTVTAVTPDGGATVRQVVTAADLLAADDAVRPALADALRQTAGTRFDLTVGPTGVATTVVGLKDPLRVRQGGGPGGLSVRVGEVLDADAWRELAGLTLFAPDPAAGPGQPWSRPVGHDWGPLGGWAGRTTFTPRGAAGDFDRFEFAHALSYRPPRNGADAGLPVRLADPRFTIVAAGGVIRYDRRAGRVVAADEVFRVRGTAAVVLAGQAVRVGVEEEQGFEVRVGKPGGGELKGRPLRR